MFLKMLLSTLYPKDTLSTLQQNWTFETVAILLTETPKSDQSELQSGEIKTPKNNFTR
jgi:hypothetical protein